MKIIEGNKRESFGKFTPSVLIRDSRLSFEARAVAMFLMSMGTRWELRATSLPFILKCPSAKGHLGRDATRKILKELEGCGYLKRTKYKNSDGQWVWDSTLAPYAGLSPTKCSDNSSATDLETEDGLAIDGGPVDNSSCVNDDGLNKTLLPLTDKGVVVNFPGQEVVPVDNSSCINDDNLNETRLPPQNDDIVPNFLRQEVVVVNENLDLTHPLLSHSKVIITQVWRKYSTQLTIEQMQQVVDEFVGVISASRYGNHSPIKSSRGWLNAVTKSMLDGDFAPEFGISIQRNRVNQSAGKNNSSKDKLQAQDPIDDATREKNRLACQNMVSTLSKGKAS